LWLSERGMIRETADWERKIREAAAMLAEDRRSGAAELVSLAIEHWLQLLREIPTEQLPEATRRWTKNLMEAQPSMAPFFHIAARLLREGKRVAWDRESFVQRCRDLKEHLEAIPSQVADAAVPILLKAQVVLTYSRSSTVLVALERVTHMGHRPRVIISEGRPMGEGVDAARKILQLGLPVRLTVDAALSAELVEAELVVFGGDSLGPMGLVNKVGTRALAAVARDHGVPIYILCGSDKWVPAAWESRIHILEHDPEEVLADPPHGLEVHNPYFDRTPLKWLTAVVSERGIFSPEEVCKQLDKMIQNAGHTFFRET
jgi:translation initiation factor 2B subunit (eIF-2B alpha/beta/delta family)